MTASPGTPPDPRQHARAGRGTLAALGVLFTLSGAAGLVHQVAWQRMLALLSGIGVQSVAVIAASFMAGLGLGSHLGGSLSTRLSARRSLRAFALLELGVAAFAVASPWLLHDVLHGRLLPLYARPALAGLVHFLTLCLPTTFMGMTLPLLTRAVVRDVESAGRRIPLLYGLNTLGAASGALLTPWVLMRHLGIAGALYVGAGLNAAAALGALLLPRPPADEMDEGRPAVPAAAPGPVEAAPFRAWLALYAWSGFTALSLEVVWFRLVEVGVKATAFTFGTVLFVYLLGVGLGSLLAIPLTPRLRHPLRAFLLIQASILALAALSLAAVAWLPTNWPVYDWFFEYWSRTKGLRLDRALRPDLFARLYLLWPLFLYGLPTLLMGCSFAVLQRGVHDDAAGSGRRVGLLQAANIAGCTLGSLLTGLLLLDRWGTTGTVRALVLTGLPFLAWGLTRPRTRRSLGPVLLVLAVLGVVLPGQDAVWRRLHGRPDDRLLLAEDATSVVALTPDREDGGPEVWRFWINGRSISWLPFGGIHTLLGAIPALVHPAPRQVAIVGLASGDTAWAASCRPETARVRVVEVCASQEALLRQLARQARPRHLADFLRDPRISIEVADGRLALAADRRASYDLVEADALLPEAPFSGNLYSLEFFHIAAARLAPGGVMCTWSPTPRVRDTFRKVFRHVIGFADDGCLVGSHRPLRLEPEVWRARLLAAEVREHLGPRNTGEVARALETARDLSAWPPPSDDVNTDLRPRDEFSSPASHPDDP